MSLRPAAMVVASALVCACWPAPPQGRVGDESSTSDSGVSMCFDGRRTGDETDIDCGGSHCEPCFGDAKCDVDEDCASAFCDAGRCAYLRSCRELQSLTNATDGVFWVDFDGDDVGAPAKVLCDQTTDGGGWMLAFKVHRATADHVQERRASLRDGFNPNLLLDLDTTANRGLASHGTLALSAAIDSDSWARITLVAGAEATRQETWFKRIASPSSLSRWFYDDDEMSAVCVDATGNGPCEQGIIARSGDLTLLGGIDLRAHHYMGDGALHMRLQGDDVVGDDAFHHASGICSMTKDYGNNAWNDTQGGLQQWGNGLLIWLR
jgi:hypothetical protein